MSVKSSKIHTNADKTVYTFTFPEEVCACCHQVIKRQSIRVTYKNPIKPMTLYEGALVEYIAYGLLSDYLDSYPPKYPKCPLSIYTACKAGQEWVENIEKVEFI